MAIIIFQTPLRYLHTSYTSNEKTEFLGVDVGSLKNEVNSISSTVTGKNIFPSKDKNGFKNKTS